MTGRHTTIVGAGLAGSLMSILLGKRGVPVRLLERRPDLRKHDLSAGRSINLALSDRGIHALKQAGVYSAVEPLLTAMPGRCIHDLDGNTQFVSYGQRAHEVIYSVSRTGLNQVLLNEAEKLPTVDISFSVECHTADFTQQQLHLVDPSTGRVYREDYTTLIGADGSNSPLRQALLMDKPSLVSSELLPHGYKELTLPAGNSGQHQLQQHALHIWPRGGFMLIALPNLDGSFTVTLFLPFENPTKPDECFSGLNDVHSVRAFFGKYFADVLTLMPDLAEELLAHHTGKMVTVRSSRWTDGNNAMLIGDAAHAIVPFHGQGMNCAFEDCVELDALMQQHPQPSAFTQFEAARLPNANAIADMALENYLEMRDTVRHPKFLLQKELSFELERRFPEQFIPRYSMVMFHHEIPYAVAYTRGQIQMDILNTLTSNTQHIDEVSSLLSAQLVQEKLSHLFADKPTIR